MRETKGFDVVAEGPFEKLVAASLVAAVAVLQLVRARDGAARRPLEDAIGKDAQAALKAVSARLEGKTERQKNPHPKGALAYAAWVFARLGGWTGYYGKPSRRHASRPCSIPRNQARLDLKTCANPVGLDPGVIGVRTKRCSRRRRR